MQLTCTITCENGKQETISLLARLDTAPEVEYFRHGGVLHNAVRQRFQ